MPIISICLVSLSHDNHLIFSLPEIYSSAAEFVKAVGKRYGNKQFSEEGSKSEEGAGEMGGAAATAGGSGGTAKASGDSKQGSTAGKGGFGGLDMDSHYAECYPGGMEEYDATYDSDEDVDFSKMDMVSLLRIILYTCLAKLIDLLKFSFVSIMIAATLFIVRVIRKVL